MTSSYDNSNSKELTVQCPSNYFVTGGGVDIVSDTPEDVVLAMQESYPASDFAWHARVVRTCDCSCDYYDWQVTVWALCVQDP
ncbi:MAG: hypothetical protein B6242_08780 [Anaerolineaceae bacterium 4572_78]|nr:MAG: hypothetical protein B6242_08780 [Anaerolineaceae bacterium 4572_78]